MGAYSMRNNLDKVSNEEDKQRVTDLVKKTIDWIDENPNAEIEEYEDNKHSLHKVRMIMVEIKVDLKLMKLIDTYMAHSIMLWQSLELCFIRRWCILYLCIESFIVLH